MFEGGSRPMGRVHVIAKGSMQPSPTGSWLVGTGDTAPLRREPAQKCWEEGSVRQSSVATTAACVPKWRPRAHRPS
jgi:hypothetical protein